MRQENMVMGSAGTETKKASAINSSQNFLFYIELSEDNRKGQNIKRFLIKMLGIR
jgi:hypothetical protein